MKQIVFLFALFFTGMVAAHAAPEPKAKSRIRYKSSDVSFDAATIHGQLKKPELSAVTGDHRRKALGVIRVRHHFLDKTARYVNSEAPTYEIDRTISERKKSE